MRLLFVLCAIVVFCYGTPAHAQDATPLDFSIKPYWSPELHPEPINKQSAEVGSVSITPRLRLLQHEWFEPRSLPDDHAFEVELKAPLREHSRWEALFSAQTWLPHHDPATLHEMNDPIEGHFFKGRKMPSAHITLKYQFN